MKPIFSLILISLVLGSCKFSRNTGKDLAPDLTSTGKDITVKDIFITVNGERTSRNRFIYGEVFYLNLNDVEGLAKENGYVFPGIKMLILSQTGDTVFQTGDLYSEYTEGMNYNPLLLTADLTIAAPIRSKGSYTQIVNVWDKKGDGKFQTEFEFSVLENDRIKVKSSGVTYDEIYLFSQGKNSVITDNRIQYNDNIYLIAEGLAGFREEDASVFPGLSLKATDSRFNEIFRYDDLFTEYTNKGVASSDFSGRVSSHFKITGNTFNNPMQCIMTVWDKKSDARITISTELNIE